MQKPVTVGEWIRLTGDCVISCVRRVFVLFLRSTSSATHRRLSSDYRFHCQIAAKVIPEFSCFLPKEVVWLIQHCGCVSNVCCKLTIALWSLYQCSFANTYCPQVRLCAVVWKWRRRAPFRRAFRGWAKRSKRVHVSWPQLRQTMK